MTTDKKCKFSIIIPFKYGGDRFDLFQASIQNLHNLTKDNELFEIVVHETDKFPKLSKNFLQTYNIKYLFSEWKGIFHRSWCLNVPLKQLSLAQRIIFFDADVIATEEWIDSVMKCPEGFYIGWDKMLNLNTVGTKEYIQTGNINTQEVERVRVPNILGAAGGITIVNKDLISRIGAWPENFKDTYGGPDNAMVIKCNKLGVDLKLLKSTVYHLNHTHTIPRDREFALGLVMKMQRWSRNQWIEEITKPWGIPVKEMIYKDYSI